MKTPKLENLNTLKPENDFIKAVDFQKEKTTTMERKTFTISQAELEHINREAMELSKETGKPVSASQALRTIIQRDKGAIS
jgi:uncharacterized linocin/CFP29 family protein